ncbi:MAG: GldG family protein [Chloroflexi bacterium]|uniref:GldG family protein n=1 Tax=Candidatus Chlorohelix allophototropha TaxID=3003348 RepID=A0A8T7LW33_9CHLR|nr:GldG family protein [Chloroflexota bacterium]WJW67002.1 GldG family protein [Chloroflexota bacterium L227-S17]
MRGSATKQVGLFAGYLIVPLFIASIISLITFQKFEPIVIVFLLGLGICLALFTATNPQTVGMIFRTHAVRNVVVTTIIVISVVGIVVLVNVLATRITVRVDTTKNQTFSISDSTVKVLDKLSEPVKVNIFYSTTSASQRDSAIDLVNEYKARTDKINYQIYDLQSLEGFTKARDMKVATDPTVVVEQGTKQETAATIDEQGLTRAIINLGAKVDRRVFFVTGHGERGPTFNSDATQGDGFSMASAALTNNNYKVDTLDLITRTGGDKKPVQLVPATDILIFVAPSSPMKSEEIQFVTTYLKQGGRAMFFYDPANLLKSNSTTSINDILKQWDGAPKFKEGLVLETDPGYVSPQNPTVLIPNVEATQNITRGIGSNQPVVYAISGSIDKGTDTTGFTSLLTTSASSYIKTDATQLSQNQAAFDAQKDQRGPLIVAASYETAASVSAATGATPTATATTPTPAPTGNGKTRFVLFAGTNFASDNTSVGINQGSNFNLFVNSINWLAEANDAIVINNKTQDTSPITISKAQDTFIYYSVVFGLPILVFFIGFVVWWRRR